MFKEGLTGERVNKRGEEEAIGTELQERQMVEERNAEQCEQAMGYRSMEEQQENDTISLSAHPIAHDSEGITEGVRGSCGRPAWREVG